ncbi:MAG: VOC family protein [Myxococcota bacterium]|nr:VOC family protein [Myxococcota bacterium]
MKLDSGVHHVSLNVDDVAACLDFYVEVLGLDVLPRPDFGFPGAWLQAGAQQIHLIQAPDHNPPKGQHFAFLVADLDAVRSELREAGVDVSNVIEIPGVGRQAFLHDPAGNMIELNQPGD